MSFDIAGLFEGLTIEEKIEVQKNFLERLPAEVRMVEDFFWEEVGILIGSIRNLPGPMESRLQGFGDGVISIRTMTLEKLESAMATLHRSVYDEVCERRTLDRILH